MIDLASLSQPEYDLAKEEGILGECRVCGNGYNVLPGDQGVCGEWRCHVVAGLVTDEDPELIATVKVQHVRQLLIRFPQREDLRETLANLYRARERVIAQ